MWGLVDQRQRRAGPAERAEVLRSTTPFSHHAIWYVCTSERSLL
jgi:hypothetical protein